MYHEAFHYLTSSIPHHNLSLRPKCLPKYPALKHHYCIYLRAAEKSLPRYTTSKTVALYVSRKQTGQSKILDQTAASKHSPALNFFVYEILIRLCRVNNRQTQQLPSTYYLSLLLSV